MSENSGIKILRYYTQKLKSFFLSKDILSFLLFLALSAAFWFVHALGKERETIISVPVIYTGVPLNVAITNTPPTEIQLSIKDQGLKLFDYSKHLNPLTIDLSKSVKSGNEIRITPEQLNSKINRYLHILPSTTILEVHPDSILIQYQTLQSKRLPVKLVSRIDLRHQYMLSNGVKLQPDWVTVYGPKKTLDSMNYVCTELVQYNDVNDTIYGSCGLKANKMLRYSKQKVKFGIFVEQYTERKVQIPVTALNCPPDLSIRTFPAYVLATYTVGLSHFNKLAPNDIQVYLDYNDLKSSSLTKQTLKIKNNTTHISAIRIAPQEVEFILEQK